ncbi:MAG: nucleotide exchange factor GrpE [Chloroflexi bacterium]|nr:nucleotide exchange factor GrpE [Chloroflexota bacterium]
MSQEQTVETPAAGPQSQQADAAEQARADAADYKDRWMRSVAEFSNYRKRTERDWADVRATAGADAIKNLLPVLDDLDRALRAVPAELQSQPWVEGFRLIERKAVGALAQAGVTPIEAIGQMFDPNLHESVAAEPSDQPHGTVLEEFRKGYRINDRVLRPAMVKIAQ